MKQLILYWAYTNPNNKLANFIYDRWRKSKGLANTMEEWEKVYEDA